MYKLKGDCFIGRDTRILLYKYLCIYKYSLLYWETCFRLVPPTRANICIYTRKLYNKANFSNGTAKGPFGSGKVYTQINFLSVKL